MHISKLNRNFALDMNISNSGMKVLAKDTAVYGLSSIVGRFLNYLLVPLYTNVISAESGGYGIVTNLYAYVALILVFLTFGMETTFFRFANKEDENPHQVFRTALGIVTTLSVIFLATVFLFISPIAHIIGYDGDTEKLYIQIMACVVALDAIQAIPFSYLRYKGKAIKFATLKLLFIALNIGLNLFVFVGLGFTDVYYVFFLNLLCTGFITFFFIPELVAEFKNHGSIASDAAAMQAEGSAAQGSWVSLCKRMLSYSWPILVLGIAGILNQTADKMLFPLVYPDPREAQVQLGIYGACVKIAMIMAMITQAFRYAYEPIVFRLSGKRGGDAGSNGSAEEKSKATQARAMKFFLMGTLFAFLCVVGYMPLLQYIIGEDYRAGLRVVPIVMVAEIMMGIYFNLSFWYKLIDKTIWGAWFSLAGCAVLVAVNVLFIPQYSYMACAWGGVAGYGTAMVLSYLVGQRKYPIDYDLKTLGVYVSLTVVLYYVMTDVSALLPTIWQLLSNTLLIALFILYLIKTER